MNQPDKFMERLKSFKNEIDEQRVPDQNFKQIEPLLALEHFNKEAIQKKSKAAAGLADWVVNIFDYYSVVKTVEPKRQALKSAEEKLEAANSKLAEVQALVADLEAKLGKLVAEYDAAIAEKNAVVAEAEKCEQKLSLAQRLVTALGSENVRWAAAIDTFTEQLRVMAGDVLMASAFVSYVGVFTKKYRDGLMVEFLNFLTGRSVPLSPESNVLAILASDAVIAGWNNQGLPSDRVSIENGAIMTNSERWPLIIDPQLQGITWIREKEKANKLQVTRMGNDKMVRVMERSIDVGEPVLIENMEESIDAVLQPVISRATIRRGRARYIKLGDKEISYSPNFKLFLHTKLSNPHYPPEIQAECTIINFTVTEQGLEDQLLALVVKKERPDLAKQKMQLIQQQNEFKIKLAELEASLLDKLTNAQGDILEDVELIENLEYTKKISVEVAEKVAVAKETEQRINEASEHYRPAAARGSLLFFLLCDLVKMHSFYMYSLDSFVVVVNRAIDSISLIKKKEKKEKKRESPPPDDNEGGEEKPAEGGAAAAAEGETGEDKKEGGDEEEKAEEGGDGEEEKKEEEKKEEEGEEEKKEEGEEEKKEEGGEEEEKKDEGEEEKKEGEGEPTEEEKKEEALETGMFGALAGEGIEEEKKDEGAEEEKKEEEAAEEKKEEEAPAEEEKKEEEAEKKEDDAGMFGAFMGDAGAEEEKKDDAPAEEEKKEEEGGGGGFFDAFGGAPTEEQPTSMEAEGQGDAAAPEAAQEGGGAAEEANSSGSRPGSSSSNAKPGGGDGDDEEEVVELTGKDLAARVDKLIDTITQYVFDYCRRSSGKLDANEVLALIQGKPATDAPPITLEAVKSWVSETMWAMARTMEQLPAFKSAGTGILANIEQDVMGWKRWYSDEKAESADLPRAFRDLGLFQRLLLLRALRPDRLTSALREFVVSNMGAYFVEQSPFNMQETYNETDCFTPMFFVLFPGVDPTPAVERCAKSVGCTSGNGKFVNISMGQGQEKIAVLALEKAAKEGGWVMLQNVHLMQSWLKSFERALELVAEYSHEDFRCVISSEPPPMPNQQIIPESVLQKCIKIADEAPQDLKANLRRAFSKFSPERLESSSKPREFKAMLFALCFFHSLILGRKKFGTWGWSRGYSFNDGDLTICGDVLHNYLEKYEQVPYEDIRYIFGEIMYGGHITDAWDRRTNNTYLEVLVVPDLLLGMNLGPGFKSPDSSKFDYPAYQKYIEEKLPAETPGMFGLHQNAEIGYLTQQSEFVFSTIQEVSGGGGGGGGGGKKEDLIKEMIEDFLGRLPENFSIAAIKERVKDLTPYIVVSLQEAERMNTLLSVIRTSLTELKLGLSGALNISDAMESLSAALFMGKVNGEWEKVAYFSKKMLGPWFADMLERVKQIAAWTEALDLLPSLWISGLFNPMSFLTAVSQVTARANGLPLDDMTLRWRVTSTKDPAEIAGQPEQGVHVHGLFLEGCTWEDGKGGAEGNLVESKPKELHPALPVVNVFAITNQEMSWETMYRCPVYVTSMRGATYVTTANMRMDLDDDPKRWILAGVALLMADD
eukprot:Cvel_27114.t1-p1 / transcript=Cvel_27114.t1 / gene=Cvel_27114 / organism=Chromera_velia_CCMP2878 / gene_product=Dynein alpha chain, flagellar outer arm, putative / transcript_product=Dynein alpha chain, flagellar outer arm, putative / location=Cvel_scaffold3327:4083-17851(-) / protein_length=1557 / sequence_SO=supercontig / SO=protein_coding / is_pseudo=false